MADPRVSVYGAIAANVAIAITKFIVAGITGSSAMLSEGIHSTVDTGNGILLLIGVRLSRRPPRPSIRSATARSCISGASSSRC
jgi:divalent metal cation (Fe/Co/Zn/Cd) transporter